MYLESALSRPWRDLAIVRHIGWGRRVACAGLSLLALAWSTLEQAPTITLSPPEAVAEGIVLHRSADASVLDPQAPAGPVGMALVRLDPSRVTLSTSLARRCSPARETVLDIANREQAVVAINAGFFQPRGAPAGLLKRDGRWIGATARARGIAVFPATVRGGPARVVFMRATVEADLRFRARLKTRTVHVDRLSPEEPLTGLSLFGAPCAEAEDAAKAGATGAAPLPPASPALQRTSWRIGRDGRVAAVTPPGRAEPAFVDGVGERLTYRGAALPSDLARLGPGTRVTVSPRIGSPDAVVLRDAPDAVGGAGLLVSGGVAVTDWSMERFSPAFAADRHPRSVVGVAADGAIWLIAVDGRQPSHSVGMSFTELQRLCAALGLRDALNLDGGGSTTLVVQGRIVNRPSDLTGPRQVSDAIVVRKR